MIYWLGIILRSGVFMLFRDCKIKYLNPQRGERLVLLAEFNYRLMNSVNAVITFTVYSETKSQALLFAKLPANFRSITTHNKHRQALINNRKIISSSFSG